MPGRRPQTLRWRRYLAVAPGSVMVRAHDLRAVIPPHDHDFLEIVVVTAGRGEHATVWGRRELQRGDVLVLPPGFWHGYQPGPRLRLWNCCLGMELVRGELGFLADHPPFGVMLWSQAQPRSDRTARGIIEFRLESALLSGVVRHLRAIAATDDRVARLGELLLLLALLGKAAPLLTKAKAPAAPHPAVRRTILVLQQQLTRPWTLDQLARHAGVNPSYLVRLFRAHVGLSPMAYLARRRCERLAGLLLRDQAPVARLAAMVGWDDANYAARRFRQTFGVSPSQFRRRQGQT